MADNNTYDDITGTNLYDSGGEKIGSIKDLFLDDNGEDPKWATVSSGIFGTKRHFVPLKGISRIEHGIMTPYAKETILDAPRVNAEEDLSEADEARLYSHYSIDDQSQQNTQAPSGRMRLRKHIVTETQHVEVPTKREVYKLEEEPANSADSNREPGRNERNSVREPAFGEVPKPSSEE